ncbi:hypothetical protein L910_1329 [Vibrio fluvialis PG41]|uniref:Uncharacterized protein n=1 Tax=Vibrio fluvialis PG41 TaxID=1336752 RepID=S7JHG1_VIBFL|nr:hypothetical protein L910_1329 [Vibrio fluvialis PG41]
MYILPSQVVGTREMTHTQWVWRLKGVQDEFESLTVGG